MKTIVKTVTGKIALFLLEKLNIAYIAEHVKVITFCFFPNQYRSNNMFVFLMLLSNHILINKENVAMHIIIPEKYTVAPTTSGKYTFLKILYLCKTNDG